MAASFEVHRAVVLEGRSLFVLTGVITEGMVRTGMRASLSDADDAFSATVHGVEFLDPALGQIEETEPALTFSYSNPTKLERWQAIEWAGKRLQLTW